MTTANERPDVADDEENDGCQKELVAQNEALRELVLIVGNGEPRQGIEEDLRAWREHVKQVKITAKFEL